MYLQGGCLLPMLMNGQVTVKDIEEENLAMAAEPTSDYRKKKSNNNYKKSTQ